MKPSLYHDIIGAFESHFIEGTLGKMYVKNGLTNDYDYDWIHIKPVSIKDEKVVQFIYKYPTKDITKNYSLTESKDILTVDLIASFRSINIFCSDSLLQYDTKDNKKLIHKKSEKKTTFSLDHDKQKNRLIPKSSAFLKRLGITSAYGEVTKKYRSKFIQINRFIELMKPYLESDKFSETVTISDMGCGKGYLTFALHHYLSENLNRKTRVIGVEQRYELVDNCNFIIQELDLSGIEFQNSTIVDHEEKSDILIALHACDTATDDAIINGIRNQSKLIVCSPCCHKALRKRINLQGPMKNMLSEGIVLERQSELLTDAIRKLILEYYGYKVSIIEFVDTEHTAKNLLLIASKRKEAINKESLSVLKELKSMWGIESYYLEEKLELT